MIKYLLHETVINIIIISYTAEEEATVCLTLKSNVP